MPSASRPPLSSADGLGLLKGIYFEASQVPVHPSNVCRDAAMQALILFQVVAYLVSHLTPLNVMLWSLVTIRPLTV